MVSLNHFPNPVGSLYHSSVSDLRKHGPRRLVNIWTGLRGQAIIFLSFFCIIYQHWQALKEWVQRSEDEATYLCCSAFGILQNTAREACPFCLCVRTPGAGVKASGLLSQVLFASAFGSEFCGTMAHIRELQKIFVTETHPRMLKSKS